MYADINRVLFSIKYLLDYSMSPNTYLAYEKEKSGGLRLNIFRFRYKEKTTPKIFTSNGKSHIPYFCILFNMIKIYVFFYNLD